jgi:hypothetical protein
VTDEIGQDKANDLSHIAKVRRRIDGKPDIKPIVENLRIFHEHAVALASAYAVAEASTRLRGCGIGATPGLKCRRAEGTRVGRWRYVMRSTS